MQDRLNQIKKELDINKENFQKPRLVTTTQKFYEDIQWLVNEVERLQKYENQSLFISQILREKNHLADGLKQLSDPYYEELPYPSKSSKLAQKILDNEFNSK